MHPEAYPVVERILDKNHKSLKDILGDTNYLKSLKAVDYVDDHFGVPTVTDIIKELDKPGRDPRPEFKTAQFADNIETMQDLKVGMVMEGAVTNVTNFGAFVDIGVHQDGLVHISALSNKFVDDPRTVVKAGDIVKVKVVEVDIARKRIALTMRLDDAVMPKQDSTKPANGKSVTVKSQNHNHSMGNSAMGNAFAAAFNKNK